MYGLYSRAASNQERPMMAPVRYIHYESFAHYRPPVNIDEVKSAYYSSATFRILSYERN